MPNQRKVLCQLKENNIGNNVNDLMLKNLLICGIVNQNKRKGKRINPFYSKKSFIYLFINSALLVS